MKLGEAKLGDEVIIFVTDEESLSSVQRPKTMKATVIGVSKARASDLIVTDCLILGWRKRERPTLCSSGRSGPGFKLNDKYTYISNQAEFLFGRGGFIGEYCIDSIIRVAKECPCGIARVDCDYHKVV